MLTSIRSAASNWLGRIVLSVIMGFLIISFAIWGIGDMLRITGTRYVATVGAVKIGAEDFRASFNNELRQIQQRLRRVVTSEEARAFGLDRELLNRAIDEAALNQQASRLGLAADQATILRSVTEAPEFRTGGLFDRNRLAEALQQAGLSEQAFIRRQGEFVLRLQLLNGLVGGMPAPASLGRAVHQFRDEERNLDLVAVPVDKVPAPVEADEAAVRAFFEERKAEFRTQETRKVTLAQISPVDFSAGLELTEADQREFYARAQAAGRFGTPEKRQAQRVLFDSEEEARLAGEKIAAGGGFDALLAERKLSEKDVDLGLKSAREIADPGLRAAIFGLEAGKISAPIKDPFGFVLIRLAKIEPAVALPFEAVKALIEPEARADKLQRDPTIRAKLDDAFKKIEDQRIAGKSLTESAAVAGIKPSVLPVIDRQGNDGAGGRITLPGGAETLNAIFASDIGLDNEPLALRDGGHVWIEVNGVEPARDKAFDEVKDEARARLVADRRDKALGEFVAGLVKRIDEGTALAAVGGELGLPVQRIAGIKRSAKDAVLGPNGVERAFAGPIGKPVSALAGDGASRLVIVPVSASLLPYDAALDEKSGFLRQIAQGMADDMMAQYTQSLRKELGVAIDQAVLTQALGQTN